MNEKTHFRCSRCLLALSDDDSVAEGRCLSCRMASKIAAAPSPSKAPPQLDPKIERMLYEALRDAPEMPKPGTPWTMPPPPPFDEEIAKRSMTPSKRWRARIYFNQKALYVGVFWDRRPSGLNVWINLIPCLSIQLVIP